MTNAPYLLKLPEHSEQAPKPMNDADRGHAELAGTRMLIAEESFDAILRLMVDTGLVSKRSAAVMLDDLSARLMMHSCGLTQTVWATRETELLHQATRIAMKAERLRAATRS